jgi:hypothetical protein
MLPSLAEFILVEQVPADIERWRRLPNGNWEVAAFRDRDAVVHFASLNCELSAEAVYRNVEGLSA